MKKFVALLALALAALALVACGSSSSSTSTTSEETAGGGSGAKEETSEGGKEGGGSVKVEADPTGNLAFTSDSISAEAGKDTLEFTNESPVPHDVKIENANGEEIGGTEIVSEGTESATVELEPGTYTFFCSVPGHRQAGMEGTLTVK